MNQDTTPTLPAIGILGAGLIGATLAGLFAQLGHPVMISSRHPEALADKAAALGCRAGTVAQAAAFGELVIAAVPLSALDTIALPVLAGKIVLDAMNYYPHRDGPIAELDERRTTTSQIVARQLPGARVVKAFNAILSYDLPREGRPEVAGGRALPLAGDDAEAKAVVAGLYRELGLEPLDAGPLADSWRFERAKPAYCIPLNRVQLQQALASADRVAEAPLGSWRRR